MGTFSDCVSKKNIYVRVRINVFFPFLVFSANNKFIVCQKQLLSLFTVCPACCGETQELIMHPKEPS